MTFRRLTALGLAAFMLHLNVVRVDVACATREMPVAQDVPAQHDMAGMHAGHDADRSDGAANESECENPAQKDCCQAVPSCSPPMGLGAETQIASWFPMHDAAAAPYSTQLLTRSTAPEPPPPRL